MARKSRISGNTEARAPAVKGICKVGIYAGVSSENSGEDTLETQVYLLKSFVEEQEDMVLAETYSDFGFTGTNFERPGTQKESILYCPTGRMHRDSQCSRVKMNKALAEETLVQLVRKQESGSTGRLCKFRSTCIWDPLIKL